MLQLAPEGRSTIEEIAHRSGFSSDATMSMLFSIVAGRCVMAQFNHPEFGGAGRWLSGGATMISDMFNNGLKVRVDALCDELATWVRNNPKIVAIDSAQSQGERAGSNTNGRNDLDLVAADASTGAHWWPSRLGVPSSVGSQNNIRYAYFPDVRRLAIELNGTTAVYDTLDHRIQGFAQQQPGVGSPSFASQLGAVNLSRLPIDASEGLLARSAERSEPSATQQRPAGTLWQSTTMFSLRRTVGGPE
jgi:hypothetical protein